MMDRMNEEVTVVDGSHYLHLRENSTGFDYVAYDKATGSKEYAGHISNEAILDCPIRSDIAAARHLAIQDIGYEGTIISKVAVDTLSRVKDAKRSWNRTHSDLHSFHNIRFITSGYDDLFRVPDGSIIQMTYQDHTALGRCEYIDDYHFRMNTEVFHICQFAETMEGLNAVCIPEPVSTDEQGAWEIRREGYLMLHACDCGWDYTLLDKACGEVDGGQLERPDLPLNEAREAILASHGFEYRGRVKVDYDDLSCRAAQMAEKGLLDRLRAIPIPKTGALAPASKDELSR